MALLAVATATGSGAGRKFYDDDPVWRDDDTVEDASAVQPWVVPDEFIAYESILRAPGDQTLNVRAQNVNTVDEVPDSSWYTNRVGSREVAPDEVACGSCDGAGPADGAWIVSEGKAEGESLVECNTNVARIRLRGQEDRKCRRRSRQCALQTGHPHHAVP